jgi:hypothetical protein
VVVRIPTPAQLKEAQSVLGAHEQLVEVLHPAVLAFFRYYIVGFSLLVWVVLLALLLYLSPSDIRDAIWDDGGRASFPMLIWVGLAALVGLGALRLYSGPFRVAYWAAVVVGLIIGILIAVGYMDGEFTRVFPLTYGLFVALISIFVAEVYRRAFTYYITDLRVVIRYRLLSTKEIDLRFEKIEDWKVSRTLLWRVLGVGTIRPYTGTEDGKVDPNRGVDTPDECLYGISNPERVRRLLVDLILERDRRGTEPTTARPAAQPAPEAPKVAYYQPAAQSATTAPKRNYERVAPQPAPETGAGGEEVEGKAEGDEAASAEEEAPEEDERIDPAAGAYRAAPSEPQPRRMFPQLAGDDVEPRLVERRGSGLDDGSSAQVRSTASADSKKPKGI